MGQEQILGGSGNIANVNARNQLLTRTISVPLIHEASLLGNAFSWTAISADVNAGDTALLVSNTADSKWLIITSVYGYSDVASQLKIHVPAPGTYAGTGVTGVNLNRNFANNAPAVAFTDETVNAFVAGNVILTLSTNELTTDQFGIQHSFENAVILGTNDAIALDVIAEGTSFECTFVGFFIDPPG